MSKPGGTAPQRPSQLSRRALWNAARSSVAELNRDNAWDWAAALTYYGVLSIFPGLLVLVSLVGLAGESTVSTLLDNISTIAPGPVNTILTEAVTGLQGSGTRAGVVAVIGLVIALWSASAYVGSFMRASNAVYDVPEGRPIWKTIPIRVAVTVATGVLLVASTVIVVVTGDLAAALGRTLGAEPVAITVWGIAKWPVLVVFVALIFAILYWASPNVRPSGFRWISPGGILAVLAWIVVSALFGLYVARFSSYDRTYGTLAGIIVFLLWLWLSNLAILAGAELNAELERQRAIAEGLPPGREPYMRLRDDSKLDRPRDDGPG